MAQDQRNMRRNSKVRPQVVEPWNAIKVIHHNLKPIQTWPYRKMNVMMKIFIYLQSDGKFYKGIISI